MLYRALVETHFRYCNVIWGQCNEPLLDKLQLLQNSAARVITKVKYEDADDLKLVCQLGWLTIRNLIKLDLGIFMYKSQNNFFQKQLETFMYLLIKSNHIRQGQLFQEMYFCTGMT